MRFRTQLLQIGIVGLVGAMAISLTSWYAQNTYRTALEVSERNAVALRNHMEGDMMHDALRGDVQRALWVANENNVADIDDVKKDVREHSTKFKQHVSENKALELSAEAKAVLAKIDEPLNTYITAAEANVDLAFKDLNAERMQLDKFNDVFSELEGKMADASDKLSEMAVNEAKTSEKEVAFAKWVQLLTIIISGATSIFLAFKIANKVMRDLGGEPADAVLAASRIGAEDFGETASLTRAPRTSLLGQLETMRAKLQQSAATAIENARVKQALDSSSTNLMLADVNRNIIYMNKAVVAMLRRVEPDLRKSLPHFSVDNVIGSNMDIFHKSPSHQSHLLANLRETYVGNIVVAGLSFRLIANPIFDDSGTRIGSVVEWIDRTKEVATENEINKILSALDASASNMMVVDNENKIAYVNNTIKAYMKRVENDFKRDLFGFNADVLLGSNFDVINSGLKEQKINVGLLTTTQVSNVVIGGHTLRLTANPILNKTAEHIGTVIEWVDRTQQVAAENDVGALVEKAVQGNFSSRISIEGKEGFYLRLAEGLNSLVATAEAGLNDVSRVVMAIANGDLTEKIESNYSGTFGELKNYCNSTTDSLSDMIGQIRTAAETIFTASNEIASGNADLSSRTEQQAANLEETASSMEELTSTVKLNADNAKQANVLAEQASKVATDGGALIQEVVTTMNAINESSQKIADIIGVIDGIAFQTNILALNAAVEAARAGDQGRGFAVVASEVRTLAQRSANAAKDIKGLISDSVKKIENGNTLVGRSGETMKEIVIAIKRVNDIMAEIAAASTEQSAGIEEVSTAVSQMDEMTQQNAALVEEAAAAAESLQSQADQLTQRVLQFRLASDDGRKSSAPAARLALPTKKTAPAVSKNLSSPENQDDEWESF